MSKSRRHLAIMFTDIVGYTALMGSDEDKAFEVLRKNREIHSKFTRLFNGTLIKEMGDGMLISFDLASEAVRCAIEIQKECSTYEIPLKIGLHEGEMIFDGHDVLGDGVNIASRVQDSAEAGYILISNAIYSDIKNKGDITAQFVGNCKFKNVNELLKVYAIDYPGCPDPVTISRKLAHQASSQKKTSQRLFISVTSLIILLAAAIIFLFSSGASVPFAERDWIVISDFENLTEEEIFDHSLNAAFTLSINQSRYVNVVGRQRMKETLQRMKIDMTSDVKEETAREIALREGVRICVIPGISKVGDQYILSSKIQDAETGDILKSAVEYAETQNDILNKLDLLIKKTRRNLGESQADIYGQSKPLSLVTTSSLNALKEYSLGIENHINMDFEMAKTHYENAINIDSNFVAAKASLGNLLFEKFDKDQGRKWLEEVIGSLDHLTDRERYGILAFYAVNVENDIDKGIDYTKSRIDLYPDDFAARNNLGWYYWQTSMFTRAIAEYKAAIHINPYAMLTYGGLIRMQLENLASLDSALVWSEKMIQLNPDNAWGYFYLGSTYVGYDNLQEAEINYKKSVELDPKFLLSQYRLAYVYRLLDQYDKSNKVLQTILDINSEEVSAYYIMGINYQKIEQEELAKASFKTYLQKAETWMDQYPDYPGTYTSIGAGWTQLGEIEKGWEIGKKAIEKDSTSHFDFAAFLSIQGKKEESLDHLEKALENGYRDIVWIKLIPDLDAIREELRFKNLISEYFG